MFNTPDFKGYYDISLYSGWLWTLDRLLACIEEHVCLKCKIKSELAFNLWFQKICSALKDKKYEKVIQIKTLCKASHSHQPLGELSNATFKNIYYCGHLTGLLHVWILLTEMFRQSTVDLNRENSFISGCSITRNRRSTFHPHNETRVVFQETEQQRWRLKLTPNFRGGGTLNGRYQSVLNNTVSVKTPYFWAFNHLPVDIKTQEHIAEKWWVTEQAI